MRHLDQDASGAPIAEDFVRVSLLVENGFVFTPIHPNAVNACRPHHLTVAAKCDLGDADIFAVILRPDGHRLAPLRPKIKVLRALVRTQLTAELGDARARFQIEDHLVAEAGIAPVS
ncbi:hypothetical protein WHT83_17875 [Aminobacter sp. P9b]|uniref:Transposase IS110-like N-terminal domain-containing protein n=1 Tax=Aminobacter ciceronei TaxID=150723 RepID=A0ABR6C4E7_9HYPH|nr:hypothetical protein [Aminobacter ciceronei]MBA8906074.1 hypothetical protein [Aminobacter ciceronei]MBA9019853.1 hypothetical protein [Aminobacter ciceronei]